MVKVLLLICIITWRSGQGVYLYQYKHFIVATPVSVSLGMTSAFHNSSNCKLM